MAFDSANKTGRTVVGLFRHRGDAEQAISDLKDAGFTRDQIGIAIKDRAEQRDLAGSAETSPAGKGAAAGAVSGGLVGGIIGLLGSLLIPGLGPIVVGGVLESVLVGAGAGLATGGLIGGLMGLGVSEEDAKHFDTGFRGGGTLVTVDAGARVDEAQRILGSHSADLGPTWAGREGAPRGRVAGTTSDPARLELREEELDLSTSYGGNERRRHQDPQYAGPERRLVGV
ncbi:MAG: general stress protein [Gemmatimonadales bacterium]